MQCAVLNVQCTESAVSRTGSAVCTVQWRVCSRGEGAVLECSVGVQCWCAVLVCSVGVQCWCAVLGVQQERVQCAVLVCSVGVQCWVCRVGVQFWCAELVCTAGCAG